MRQALANLHLRIYENLLEVVFFRNFECNLFMLGISAGELLWNFQHGCRLYRRFNIGTYFSPIPYQYVDSVEKNWHLAFF